MNINSESIPETAEAVQPGEEKNKKRKKKGKKIFRKVLAVFFAVIVLIAGVTASANLISLQSSINKAHSFPNAGCAPIKVENYADGCWNIFTDKGLKVLQLTDLHLGGGWMSVKQDSMAINAVAAMIKAEKPDFVIVTGDIAYTVPIQAGTFNNKSGSRILAELMEKLGVYWTLTFGNHDAEVFSWYSLQELTKFYSSGAYPHCLFQRGPADVDGSGNQVFNIVNSDGFITRSFILLDSHAYTDGDAFGIHWRYDNLHANQIKWYTKTVKELNVRNAETLKALPEQQAAKYSGAPQILPTTVFLHIPLYEYRDAWDEYAANGYKNTANVKYKYGVAGQNGKVVYCGIHRNNFFKTMLSLGSTDTVFCGHDHLNNFSLNYKGIELTYGMSIDYLAYPGIYKLGAQRGCTVINISSNGAIDYNEQNYYQAKYTSYYPKETVTMQQYANNHA